MNTYIILSRFSPEAFDDPKHFLELAEQVSKKIKSDCPGVRWKDSYAILGRFDVVDIVEASDPQSEADETRNKARAMLKAVELAEKWKEKVKRKK